MNQYGQIPLQFGAQSTSLEDVAGRFSAFVERRSKLGHEVTSQSTLHVSYSPAGLNEGFSLNDAEFIKHVLGLLQYVIRWKTLIAKMVDRLSSQVVAPL